MPPPSSRTPARSADVQALATRPRKPRSSRTRRAARYAVTESGREGRGCCRSHRRSVPAAATQSSCASRRAGRGCGPARTRCGAGRPASLRSPGRRGPRAGSCADRGPAGTARDRLDDLQPRRGIWRGLRSGFLVGMNPPENGLSGMVLGFPAGRVVSWPPWSGVRERKNPSPYWVVVVRTGGESGQALRAAGSWHKGLAAPRPSAGAFARLARLQWGSGVTSRVWAG